MSRLDVGRWRVTVTAPDAWADPNVAYNMAAFVEAALDEAAQTIANVAPQLDRRELPPVRVTVTDLDTSEGVI